MVTLSPVTSTKPYLVWCNTIKGNGLSLMENDPEGWHHRVISESDYEKLNKELI